MAFNIAPFIAYNLTRPKNRKEEKTVEIAKCPQCGADCGEPICEIKDIVDDKVVYEEEFFCVDCDESFYHQKTGTIVWD
jgi:hypothetical protein